MLQPDTYYPEVFLYFQAQGAAGIISSRVGQLLCVVEKAPNWVILRVSSQFNFKEGKNHCMCRVQKFGKFQEIGKSCTEKAVRTLRVRMFKLLYIHINCIFWCYITPVSNVTCNFQGRMRPKIVVISNVCLNSKIKIGVCNEWLAQCGIIWVYKGLAVIHSFFVVFFFFSWKRIETIFLEFQKIST